jgi:hypothetical protein
MVKILGLPLPVSQQLKKVHCFQVFGSFYGMLIASKLFFLSCLIILFILKLHLDFWRTLFDFRPGKATRLRWSARRAATHPSIFFGKEMESQLQKMKMPGEYGSHLNILTSAGFS